MNHIEYLLFEWLLFESGYRAQQVNRLLFKCGYYITAASNTVYAVTVCTSKLFEIVKTTYLEILSKYKVGKGIEIKKWIIMINIEKLEYKNAIKQNDGYKTNKNIVHRVIGKLGE